MKLCNHEWSSKPHVGRESRICGRCNEWEVDVGLAMAEATIVSLAKQRDDACLDLREAKEAWKAERAELEAHLSQAEDERDRFRGAFAVGFRSARDAAIAACEKVFTYCEQHSLSPGRIVTGPNAAVRCIEAIQGIMKGEALQEKAAPEELLDLVRVYREYGEFSDDASQAHVSIALRRAMPLLITLVGELYPEQDER